MSLRAVHIQYKTEPLNFPVFLFWFLFCLVGLVWVLGVFAGFFFPFPYSYTMDSMCIGDGQINCGSRWTWKVMGTEAFATFWILQEKTMQNFGFLKSLWLHSCCQAQELLIPAGRSIPEERWLALKPSSSASQCLTAAIQAPSTLLNISLNTTLAIQYTNMHWSMHRNTFGFSDTRPITDGTANGGQCSSYQTAFPCIQLHHK